MALPLLCYKGGVRMSAAREGWTVRFAGQTDDSLTWSTLDACRARWNITLQRVRELLARVKVTAGTDPLGGRLPRASVSTPLQSNHTHGRYIHAMRGK